MTAVHDVRIADAHWLLEGRHYRFTVASLDGDCVTADQRSLGVVMRGDGTVGVGIVAPRCAAAVTLTLSEAHQLGQALLSLEPKCGPSTADLGSGQ
jgi:hypothetical protein